MVSEQFKGQARLPGFAIPKRYDLTLQPDLIHCTFSGSVEITVDVVAETRSIVLNAADLTFDGDGPVSFRISNSSQVSKVLSLFSISLSIFFCFLMIRIFWRSYGRRSLYIFQKMRFWF